MARPRTTSTLILDNGASTIKTGIAGDEQYPRLSRLRIVQNAVIRSKGDKTTYFGHEFDNCRDYASLHYRLPCEKGYIVDWDAQKAVWDGIFSEDIDPAQTTLLITEPYFNLPNIQDVYDQFMFEEYEFAEYMRVTPASLIPHGSLFPQETECMVVVDSGFSFTHVVPIMNGSIVWQAVKRIDVGGKLLTNHLKELVSFRQWNMMDETYIMNQIKEACCFVSGDFAGDLRKCRYNPKGNSIIQEYILPDLSKHRKGRIRMPDDILADTDQILVMNNERFCIPELVFRPDDIGLEQTGLAGTIALSISQLPSDLQGMFWANIGLIGGNTMFPGFRERLLVELQTLAPVDCDVVIYECEDAITEAYRAAYSFATSSGFAHSTQVVTRAEYAESGSNASRRKFRDWKPHETEKEKPSVREASKLKGKQKEDDRSHVTGGGGGGGGSTINSSRLSKARTTRTSAAAAGTTGSAKRR
ncbi:actin family [Cyathus striatus]|nr:actin family [Cyathus striatus]